MRPYLIAASLVLGAVLLAVLGWSFTKDKADVGRAMVLIGCVGTGSLLSYCWAIYNRYDLIAKIGQIELGFQIRDVDLPADLLAELHDFACHVVRHREVPNWRAAVVRASLTKPAPPPAITEPSPQPRATGTAANPPAPRAAAMPCQGCGSNSAKPYETPIGVPIQLCDTCKPTWIPDTTSQPVSV
jgi:hypothetical protein